jgi:hypothetical protein
MIFCTNLQLECGFVQKGEFSAADTAAVETETGPTRKKG